MVPNAMTSWESGGDVSPKPVQGIFFMGVLVIKPQKSRDPAIYSLQKQVKVIAAEDESGLMFTKLFISPK